MPESTMGVILSFASTMNPSLHRRNGIDRLSHKGLTLISSCTSDPRTIGAANCESPRNCSRLIPQYDDDAAETPIRLRCPQRGLSAVADEMFARYALMDNKFL